MSTHTNRHTRRGCRILKGLFTFKGIYKRLYYFPIKYHQITIVYIDTCIAQNLLLWCTSINCVVCKALYKKNWVEVPSMHLLEDISVSPPPVNCFDRLHCQRCGHQVISIVAAPAHHQQPLNLPHNKHQTSLWRRKVHSARETEHSPAVLL